MLIYVGVVLPPTCSLRGLEWEPVKIFELASLKARRAVKVEQSNNLKERGNFYVCLFFFLALHLARSLNKTGDRLTVVPVVGVLSCCMTLISLSKLVVFLFIPL